MKSPSANDHKAPNSKSASPSLPQAEDSKDASGGGGGRAAFSKLLSENTYENLYKDAEPELEPGFVPPPPPPAALFTTPSIVLPTEELDEPSTEEVHDPEEEQEEERDELEEDGGEGEWIPPKVREVPPPPPPQPPRRSRSRIRTTVSPSPEPDKPISMSNSDSNSNSNSTSSTTTTKKRRPSRPSKGVMGAPFLPDDAPIQPRNYQIDSRTSLKPIPKILLKKHEEALQEGKVTTEFLEDEAARRRRLNTLNARESRKRKAELMEAMENRIKELKGANKELRNHVGELEYENEELRKRVAELEFLTGVDEAEEKNGKRSRKG
jgi:hypothetical protein